MSAGAIALVVYAATLPPSLTWAHNGADGGDLAAAIVRGALPHPPGFPTYLLFGDLFARLPLGEPAWRLSVMSAIFAAGAVVLTIATARRAGANTVAAIAAGLSLAFAPLFWSQAIIVEVYACAAFFAALLIFLTVHDAPLWVRGLVLGIATGAHPILVFFFPMALAASESDSHGRLESQQHKPEDCPPLRFASGAIVRSLTQSEPTHVGFVLSLPRFLIAWLIGWLAMYVFVLLALNRAPSPWGDVSTIARWWSFVSGELYRGYLFAFPLADMPARLVSFVALMTRQFTPVGAFLALIGIVPLWRARRDLARAALISFALVVLFAIGYNTTDSFVYLTVVLPLAALWLAFGLTRLTHFVSGFRFQVSRWIVLLLPLMQLVLFYGEMDLRADHSAVQWAERVLHDAPPQAILLTERDAHTFTLWYAHDALHARPDVVVLDRDLWAYAPYRQMMVREFGLADDPVPEQAALKTARPLARVSDKGLE